MLRLIIYQGSAMLDYDSTWLFDIFAGVYAWPDRRAEVKATDTGLVIDADGAEVEARPVDDRTFVVDASDPDNPTVTFGAFDERGRPHALYLMLLGLPRV